MTTIKNIHVVNENSLFIEFSDGATKTVNLKTYFSKGIFSELKDPGYLNCIDSDGFTSSEAVNKY